MPASPASVSAEPPRAMASFAISARPRVMSAARVLCPNPMPSTAPGGDGDDVLQRAPALDARHVVARVGAQVGRVEALHHVRARRRRLRDAMTTAVGRRFASSFGEARARQERHVLARVRGQLLGEHLVHEHERVVLDALRRAHDGDALRCCTCGAAARATSRVAWLGTTKTTMCAPSSAASRSSVAREFARQRRPGQITRVLVARVDGVTQVRAGATRGSPRRPCRRGAMRAPYPTRRRRARRPSSMPLKLSW